LTEGFKYPVVHSVSTGITEMDKRKTPKDKRKSLKVSEQVRKDLAFTAAEMAVEAGNGRRLTHDDVIRTLIQLYRSQKLKKE